MWGALAVVLPEVDRLRGVEQNPYHHLDVFEHTLEALTYVRGVVAQLGGRRFLTPPAEAGLPGVEPLVPVSWAVLLHDIGKPASRVVDERGPRHLLAPRRDRPRRWPPTSARALQHEQPLRRRTSARSSASTCGSGSSCASSR